MGGYLLKRFLHVIPTLLIISVIGFTVINLPPGTYLDSLIAEYEARGDTSAQVRLQGLQERYGLDRPVYQQYLIWISGFVRGDFGQSFDYNRPVSTLIWERLALTLVLSISTMLFTWCVAIPIGIYSATHQYSLGDQIFTFIGFIGLSVPGFLLALIAMVIALFWFGQSVGGLFSPEYVEAPWSLAKALDMVKHLWIPVVIIGASGTAGLIRIMRGNLLDVLGRQYVQVARAKGLHERTVVFKHAVRVAINPLISIAGMQLPVIISGEAITAIVLNLPTTGPLFYRALLLQDMYLAGTFLMFLTIMLVIGNLLADVALAFIDPRIRYD